MVADELALPGFGPLLIANPSDDETGDLVDPRPSEHRKDARPRTPTAAPERNKDIIVHDDLEGHRRRLLKIYLNDHLAGAVGGAELARRCLRSNRGTPLGTFLKGLLNEILEDRRALEDVMARLDVAADRSKLLAVTIGERVARLKLNGQLLGYSDLSRVVELEALCAGVALKGRLWRSLDHVRQVDTRLAGVDFVALAERASAQLDGVERHRLAAVARAFAPSS